MNGRYEKTVRIASELILYCKYIGGTTCQVTTDIQQDYETCEISSPIAHFEHEELEKLKNDLNQPRDRAMETIYMLLCGQPEHEPQIRLIGAMVDEAKISYENGILHIWIIHRP